LREKRFFRRAFKEIRQANQCKLWHVLAAKLGAWGWLGVNEKELFSKPINHIESKVIFLECGVWFAYAIKERK
jgi:hypothetical protein